MCRLFGGVSSEITSFTFSLQQAPRSLAALSTEHPHGWGLAVHDGRRGWELHRNPACAGEDARFRSLAATARGRVMVAHVRKRTVGATSIVNTHPFHRGHWVFAHNGTIEDLDYLHRRTSAARRREIEGETDSERFFAFLLTVADGAGGADGVRHAKPGAVDAALAAALDGAMARPRLGAANFLLSDGEVLYAFRFGRSLHALRRDAVRRTAALLIASERVTDEPWDEIRNGTLLRIDGGSMPSCRALLG